MQSAVSVSETNPARMNSVCRVRSQVPGGRQQGACASDAVRMSAISTHANIDSVANSFLLYQHHHCQLSLPSLHRLRHAKLARRHQQQQQKQRTPQCSAAVQVLTALQTSPVRDIAATLFTGAGAVAWVKLWALLARHEVFEQKLSRKLVHMTSGPLYVAMWPLFSSAPHARYCAGLICMLNALRLILIGTGTIKSVNTVRAVSRENDRRELLRGPLYYVLVLLAVTVCFWRCSPAGLIPIALMCGGDGIADIVGRRYGAGNPLPHNRNKSWAGSAAMFIGGFGMATAYVIFFHALGYFQCDLPSTVAGIAVISLVATVVESLPINQVVDDNLSVPAVAAVMGHLMLRTAAVL